MTSNLLLAMVAAARRSADERAKGSGVSAIERAAADRAPRADGFRASLRQPGIRVIAECKRRSPSRGVLRADYDPAAIARGYEAAGAAAISVLTDPAFFDGALDHLVSVRAAVQLPVLRKDFIVTPFQILEARAAGADAILLIVAALDDATLCRLIETAASLGLAALVEVHDRDELDRAASAGATIVGVNSRNLRTLEVDIAVFDVVAPAFTSALTTVAESGLKTESELRRLRGAGYHAFLMGERFMSAPDPGRALADLRRAAEALPEARP